MAVNCKNVKMVKYVLKFALFNKVYTLIKDVSEETIRIILESIKSTGMSYS